MFITIDNCICINGLEISSIILLSENEIVIEMKNGRTWIFTVQDSVAKKDSLLEILSNAENTDKAIALKWESSKRSAGNIFQGDGITVAIKEKNKTYTTIEYKG